MDRLLHPRRQPALLLGVVATVLAVLAAGAWGLTADRGQGAHAQGDRTGYEWVAVPGGWLQVSDVTTRSMDHQPAPGMATMPDTDPVASGMVRIKVGVVLAADRADLAWSDADFRLTGAGTAPLPPHEADLGDGVVPRASQVAGGLVFDVPEDARNLRLRFRDGPLLPVEVELTGHGPDDQAPITAKPSPDDDHHDEGHDHP